MTVFFVLVSAALAAALTWAFTRQALLTRLSETEKTLAVERAAAAEREASLQQRLSDLEQVKASMQTAFEAAAGKVFDAHSGKFVAQNKTQVEALLTPLAQRIREFRERVETVHTTDTKDRSALQAQIEQLQKLNTTLSQEAKDLTTALKGNSQMRGAWGELVLERLLESAGLIKGENYLVQASTKNEGGQRQRPDAVLRLPEGRDVIIDSKVSLVAYENAANAPDEATVATAIKEHLTSVRRHVEELSAKRYEEADKFQTPDFVLMFVPLESAFIAALRADPTLYEWAAARRVVLCSASTLLVTLKTVALFWQQDRQNKNAQDIADRAGKLHDKFMSLLEDLKKLGDQLSTARKTYDTTLTKLSEGSGNLVGRVVALQKLGAKAKKALPSGFQLAESDTTDDEASE